MQPIQYIDWSSKHNILIRNADGSLTPMDEPYFRSRLIAPGTWQILSSGDYSYLLEGSRKAIAIDCGYGAGNIRNYMQSLTKRPLSEVINTHDHFDHTANNAYFDRAYMSEQTVPLATIPFRSFEGVNFPRDYEHVVVKEGDIIDIGDRPLEIFFIPDHAVGSIAILDRTQRYFFVGDEVMPWGKILNVGLTTYHGYLQKMEAHRSEYDFLAAGAGIYPAEVLDRFLDCCEYILEGHEGENADDMEVPQFHEEYSPDGRLIYDRTAAHPGDGGAGKMADDIKGRKKMTYHDATIVYDPEKISL